MAIGCLVLHASLGDRFVMLPTRHALLGTLAALALVAIGCSSSPSDGSAEDAASSPSTSAPSTTTTETTEPTAPTSAAPDCAVEAPTTVPDGRWKGPIDLAIEAKGEGGVVPSTSTGGTLTMTVENGEVTGGRWDVAFVTKGDVSQQGQSAFLDVTVDIKGPVTGTGKEAVVEGAFHVGGSVTVDVAGKVPLDFSGPASETMDVVTTTCYQVTGTFVPSLNSEGSPVNFSGLATWTGTRVG